MKKILACAVGGAAVAAAILGAEPALADNEYAGITYEKAAEDISRYGKAVIVSRIGDYLPTEQCIVVGSRSGNSLDSSGNIRGGTVLLNLNCNDTYAGTSGHAGNSAATPEGKKALKYQQMAKNISEDFSKATAAGKAPYCENNLKICVSVCQKAEKACSGDLLSYLGL